jgi:SET domain-containing protein
MLLPRVAVVDLLRVLVVRAGTYIFRLNADYCVDATRAGNIAHLINHSCAPCCHSRTITVRCPSSGQLCDHVVIVASRDIAVGEWR